MNFLPAPDQPAHWLPRHGEPGSIVEWLIQKGIRLFAFLPFYTAIIVTLMLFVLLRTQ